MRNRALNFGARALGWMTVLCALLQPVPAAAQASAETYLPLDGTISADGRKVTLVWDEANPLRVGNVTINRRELGQRGITSWQGIAPTLGPKVSFEDQNTQPGVAYEYQVLRSARDIVDIGYWVTGVGVPAVETPGHAIVVVDQTLAEDLAPRLDRLLLGLAGEGWAVTRLDTPRGDAENGVANLERARALKEKIRAVYGEDPETLHALILVGRVPVVHSGRVRPDGHDPQAVPTDLFYADMDGDWPDDGAGTLLPAQVPGNHIALQVGRIDFAGISRNERAQEIAYLRAYLDKDHHWRQGMLGDLREAYGQSEHLVGERMGLRNIVGPRAVTEGGHHDVGEEHPWLWGVDFGDAGGGNYPGYANKAVFTINFGSNKHFFDGWMNPMTGLLAQPFYTLSVGWGGRPSWWIHAMGLGRTIGDAHMRTVNNGRANGPYRLSMDYLPTGQYLWRNPVWVNLLGDPTLHAFPLAPPRGLRAETGAGGADLGWTASADPGTLGYKVYRAEAGSLDFTPLTPDPITKTAFHDPDPAPGAWYMVRAYGLKQVHAGSFYTYSQGAFAKPGETPAPATEFHATTTRETPVTLAFGAAPGIHAIVAPPAHASMTLTPEGWVLTPEPGFEGEITLRTSRFDGTTDAEGTFTVTVAGDPPEPPEPPEPVEPPQSGE